jgi:hypothetical protein
MNTLISVVRQQSCGECEPSRSALEILLSRVSWSALVGGGLFLCAAYALRSTIELVIGAAGVLVGLVCLTLAYRLRWNVRIVR